MFESLIFDECTRMQIRIRRYSNYSLHVYHLNLKISRFRIESIEIPRPMKQRSINVAWNEIDCCGIKNSFCIQAPGKILDNRRVDDDRLRGKTQAEERKTEHENYYPISKKTLISVLPGLEGKWILLRRE